MTWDVYVRLNEAGCKELQGYANGESVEIDL